MLEFISWKMIKASIYSVRAALEQLPISWVEVTESPCKIVWNHTKDISGPLKHSEQE